MFRNGVDGSGNGPSMAPLYKDFFLTFYGLTLRILINGIRVMLKVGSLKLINLKHDFGFLKIQDEDYLFQKKTTRTIEWKKTISDEAGGLDLELVRSTGYWYIAYNVVNAWTLFELINMLSNMYKKPSIMNNVFLIR